MLMSSSRHAVVVVCSYVALDVHLSFPPSQTLLGALFPILSPLILCIDTYLADIMHMLCRCTLLK
jgi:hypothetical protein